MSNYMDKEKGRTVLLELKSIFDAIELPFFLMQGTALGAHRDQNFTPSERDIDLGFMSEPFVYMAPKICYALTNSGFDIETISAPFTKIRTIVAKKHGCKADLVSFAYWRGKRFASSPVDPVNVPKPYCIVHDAPMLENWKPIEFFGEIFNAPAAIEEYLRLEYGTHWDIPTEDHISKTRVYDYVANQPIPLNLLEDVATF